MKCLGCGIEKDLSVLETYPYEDSLTTEVPVDPLLVLECQPTQKESKWRMVIVCHECFHKLDPDMWISERCWEAISAITPYHDLPAYSDDYSTKWNLETYAV